MCQSRSLGFGGRKFSTRADGWQFGSAGTRSVRAIGMFSFVDYSWFFLEGVGVGGI